MELLAARALRHCLKQGLGSGMQACRLVTAGMAGAVVCDGLGTGRTAVAVRPRIPALADRLILFCRTLYRVVAVSVLVSCNEFW